MNIQKWIYGDRGHQNATPSKISLHLILCPPFLARFAVNNDHSTNLGTLEHLMDYVGGR